MKYFRQIEAYLGKTSLLVLFSDTWVEAFYVSPEKAKNMSSDFGYYQNLNFSNIVEAYATLFYLLVVNNWPIIMVFLEFLPRTIKGLQFYQLSTYHWMTFLINIHFSFVILFKLKDAYAFTTGIVWTRAFFILVIFNNMVHFHNF